MNALLHQQWLKQHQTLFETAFDVSTCEKMITDATGTVLHINQKCLRHYQNLPNPLHHKIDDLLYISNEKQSLAEVLANGCYQGEVTFINRHPPIDKAWLVLTRVSTNTDEVYYLWSFCDIEAIINLQSQFQNLATHDSLTMLPNRMLFMDRLTMSLHLANRLQQEVVLLFIDLDNFKQINDTDGHARGDQLLIKAATRLLRAVRENDTVARMGGDEFTAILTGCSSAEAGHIADRILTEMSRAFHIEDRRYFVSASIGMAIYPKHTDDIDTLLKLADMAMYKAKEAGKNRIVTFSAEMNEEMNALVTLQRALHEAIIGDDLYLVYQPKYSPQLPDRLLALEVLLRWDGPEGILAGTQAIIESAEKNGAIHELSNHIEHLLFKQLAVWHQSGLKLPLISFNVSAKCLQEVDYAKNLLTVIESYGLMGIKLCIEITETALLSYSEHVRDNLYLLNAAGIDLSIDDFGTGYASLNTIKQLACDELKIDKRFTDGVGLSREDESIARTIIALARTLGMRVVAEGVETKVQYDWLTAHGCDLLQGYYLSYPLKSQQIECMLRREI